MPPDENVTTPAPVPAPAPVQPENPTAPAAPAAPPAPPPATAVVVAGTKTEREIELEQRLTAAEQKIADTERAKREAEIIAAEKQRDAEAIARKYSEKRKKKGWSDPVFED